MTKFSISILLSVLGTSAMASVFELKCPYAVSVLLVQESSASYSLANGEILDYPHWKLLIKQKLYQEDPEITIGAPTVKSGEGYIKFSLDEFTIWKRGKAFAILGGPYGGLDEIPCQLVANP